MLRFLTPRLLFSDNLTMEMKLRWLSDVNKALSSDRELAEVKMFAVTSRFVYISRKHTNIIESVTNGEFLPLKLDVQDSIERPRKLPSNLVTQYPVDVDSRWQKSFPVHTLCVESTNISNPSIGSLSP